MQILFFEMINPCYLRHVYLLRTLSKQNNRPALLKNPALLVTHMRYVLRAGTSMEHWFAGPQQDQHYPSQSPKYSSIFTRMQGSAYSAQHEFHHQKSMCILYGFLLFLYLYTQVAHVHSFLFCSN